MAHLQSWQSTMTFSDRLPVMVKITAQLQQANPASSPSEAKARAKALEKDAYQKATSREEYDKLCNISVPSTSKASAGQPTQESPPPDDISSLPPSDVRIGKYTNAVHHRSGLFSTIYKALNPTTVPPRLVALKVTNPSSTQPPHDSHREARLLQRATSPHIISLLETFPQPGGLLVLAMPYIPYDLSTLLHPPSSTATAPLPILTPHQRKSLIRDILHALTHIHSLGIIHRDIKPANILLRSPSGPAYLIDFGIAWSDTDTDTAASATPAAAAEPAEKKITDIGTTCYRAPELLFGCTWYGAGVDLWAFGCVVAEVATWGGREPGLGGGRRAGEERDGEMMEERRRQWREQGTLFDSGELGSDLALLLSIFRSLGTPTVETWPEARRFPDWGKMEFYEFQGKGWEVLLPGVEEQARDFVGKLVRFESKERMEAREALEHAWIAGGGGIAGEEGVVTG